MCKVKEFSRPLFSVIIPVYQCESTLNACIESVLLQHEKCVEIVLVDDGSTDRSGLICDLYKEKYPATVTVIHKANEGPLAARLDGIQASIGQYVMFLDADDKYVSGIFDKLKSTIESTTADMVIFNYFRVFSDNQKKLNVSLYNNGQIFEGIALMKLFEDAIAGSNLNALWQKCVRREFLLNTEILRKYERLLIGEDKLLSLQIMACLRKVIYLADGLYEYHISQNSLSHRLGLKHYQDMEIVLSEIKKISLKLRMNDSEYLYSKSKVEFGISCLYSTAQRVLIQLETICAFNSLFEYIKTDQKFWKAYSLCGFRLTVHKQFTCWLLHNGWVRPFLQYYKYSIQTKKLIRFFWRKRNAY